MMTWGEILWADAVMATWGKPPFPAELARFGERLIPAIDTAVAAERAARDAKWRAWWADFGHAIEPLLGRVALALSATPLRADDAATLLREALGHWDKLPPPDREPA